MGPTYNHLPMDNSGTMVSHADPAPIPHYHHLPPPLPALHLAASCAAALQLCPIHLTLPTFLPHLPACPAYLPHYLHCLCLVSGRHHTSVYRQADRVGGRTGRRMNKLPCRFGGAPLVWLWLAGSSAGMSMARRTRYSGGYGRLICLISSCSHRCWAGGPCSPRLLRWRGWLC